MTCARTAVVLLSLLPALALAEMQALDDSILSEMSGQGGVYLSGEFSINKDGGVLWGTPATNNPAQWTANQRSCALAGATSPESCGMRVAVRSGANAGWYVLDNLKGIFSFEGLTLDTRTLTSASGEREVLALGLPNEIRFKDGNFSFGVASQGGWKNKALSAANGGDPSYQQTNIFSAKIDGSIRMQGSVLVFPTN
ncbi:hypothetical protein DFO61_5171 [Ectopseudomonas oleovorans]|uniref:DUF6160 domain-containing protein n=1 Tax=Ectopseudomonas oleovorans TaxID=301 RepID=A0A397M2F8_ECTOL|nr:DUF6160 family protein [Pseudomonas oleovorans]RIA17799.1 hypothetical protein DFO61_5171 [Pseudomonas oleovorans]